MLIPVACLQLPTIIADNAGYDSADLVAQLRAAHQENKTTFGLSEFGRRATAPVHRRAAEELAVAAILNAWGFFPLRHV